VIALAVLHQVLQCIAQLPQLADLVVQLFDMLASQRLDVGTGPLPVLPQFQQLADLLQGKPQIPRTLDECQGVQVVVAI
jgi:hypothetical protein